MLIIQDSGPKDCVKLSRANPQLSPMLHFNNLADPDDLREIEKVCFAHAIL